MTTEPVQDLDAEDEKLITLARSARVRNGAPQGAAVRDATRRTYLATTVELPSLRLSAVHAAIAAAVSSGAEGVEALAVVGAENSESDGADLAPADAAVARDMGVSLVLLASADGTVQRVSRP